MILSSEDLFSAQCSCRPSNAMCFPSASVTEPTTEWCSTHPSGTHRPRWYVQR